MLKYFRYTGLVALTTGALIINGLHAGQAKAEESTAQSCSESRVDMDKLNKAAAWIEANKTFLDSFIVLHCDNVMVEKYYNGYHADKRHDLQSATKTFSAALIGIALHEGLIDSIDQPLIELLPDYKDILVGGKEKITLRHLLAMTSGLKWTDFGPERSFEFQAAAKDSAAYILGEPLVSDPGEKFFYNTGSSHLLSVIISERTGMPASEYARKKLFSPLGVKDFVWNAHSDGRSEGGWQLYLRPRDMLKFGKLYLDGGVWQGKRLIDESYIDEATRQQVDTNGGPGGGGYGFQMWIERDFGTEDIAAARGWAGQEIIVLEELDTVVVFNGNIMHMPENTRDVKRIMNEFIVPAHQ